MSHDSDEGSVSDNEGWTINDWHYPPGGKSLNGQLTSSIVPRAAGYVPYQSMFDPDGHHAYDRSAVQYPRMRRNERADGRVAETPYERTLAYQEMRPRGHEINEIKPLGIYSDGVVTRDQGRGRSPSGMRINDSRRRTLPDHFHEPYRPSVRRRNSGAMEIQERSVNDPAGTATGPTRMGRSWLATVLETRDSSRRGSAERDPRPNIGSSRRPSPRRVGRSPSPYMRETHRRTPRRATRSPSPYPREVDRRSSRRKGHGGASGGRR